MNNDVWVVTLTRNQLALIEVLGSFFVTNAIGSSIQAVYPISKTQV